MFVCVCVCGVCVYVYVCVCVCVCVYIVTTLCVAARLIIIPKISLDETVIVSLILKPAHVI